MILSFLSYGEKYHKEFLEISKNFKKENIVVASDKIFEEYHTVLIKDDFNFNLKELSITESLGKGDSVLYIDTDTIVKNPNYNILNELDDGIYVKWIGNEVEYLNEIITSKRFSYGKTSRSDVNKYGKELFNIVGKPIKFIDECILYIKLKGDIKNEFIKTYKDIVYKFKNNTPYRETDDKWGAMEGCIIWSVSELLNINIDSTSLSEFFKEFEHYGPTSGHSTKNIKTVI